MSLGNLRPRMLMYNDEQKQRNKMYIRNLALKIKSVLEEDWNSWFFLFSFILIFLISINSRFEVKIDSRTISNIVNKMIILITNINKGLINFIYKKTTKVGFFEDFFFGKHFLRLTYLLYLYLLFHNLSYFIVK